MSSFAACLLFPALRADAATSVDKQHNIQGVLADERFRNRLVNAWEHVARLVLLALPAVIIIAVAVADGRLRDEFRLHARATIALLGAVRPLGPVLENAILVAILDVAALDLRILAARLTSVLRLHTNCCRPLLDTTATLGGAA